MAKLRKSKAAASRKRVLAATASSRPKAPAPGAAASPPAPRGVRRLGGRVA
jgi:hypothetical protein